MASIAMSNSERPRLRENGVCPMPTMAALSPIAFIAASPSAEGDRHADEAVHERRAQRYDLAREREVGKTVEEFLEQHARLEPCEARAQAEVLPEPEGDVHRVRRAADVEHVGGGAEDLLVAVARCVEEEHVVAGRDPSIADLGVPGRGTREAADRRHPAQHLLDRAREAIGLL